jgi:hypothetical protein
MAYDISDNNLASISGAIALDIDQRIRPSSPWIALPKKGVWPDEIGHQFNTLTMERASISGAQTWQAHAAPTGTGSAPCTPPATDATFNTSQQTVTLESTALRGPQMCVEDLRSKFRRKEQIEMSTQALQQLIRDAWIVRNRDEYVRVAGRKIVLAAGLPETGTVDGDTFDATAASDSRLTNEILDDMYMHLLREGVRMFASAMSGGQPILSLITSAETSRALIKDDSSVRTDFRESTKADDLLKGLGHTHTYNGYLHMIDDTPRRSTWAGSVWTMHEPFADDGGTGFPEQNPAYIAADHEDSIIFVSEVYECLVPGSISNIGNLKFEPQNYIGDVQWLNYKTDDNPLGTIGRYYAKLGSATRPKRTEFGIVLRHLRCAPTHAAIAC